MLPLKCPFCDRANSPDSHYCSNCGQRLHLEASHQGGVVNDRLAAYRAERIREALSGSAKTVPPVARSADAALDSASGSPMDAAEDMHDQPLSAQREPAIARRWFRTQSALQLPSDVDSPPTRHLNLSGQRPRAPDLEPVAYSAQTHLQDASEGSPSEFVHPAYAVEESPGTDVQLRRVSEPAAPLHSTLRRPSAALISAMIVGAIAVTSYYAYRGTQESRSATAQQESTPVGVVQTDMLQPSRDMATGTHAPAGRITSSVDPTEFLGIDPPTEASMDVGSSPARQPTDTLNQAISPPPASMIADQVQHHAPGAGRAPTAGDQSRNARAPAAATRLIESAPKQSRPAAPPAATPVDCTAGVAALGLCKPTPQEEGK